MKEGFGFAHIKKEGAPAHPEDIYIHCGCTKCEVRWQKQLKAYNDYWDKDLIARQEPRATTNEKEQHNE